MIPFDTSLFCLCKVNQRVSIFWWRIACSPFWGEVKANFHITIYIVMWYYVTRFFPICTAESYIFSLDFIQVISQSVYSDYNPYVYIYIYAYDPITYELCHVNTWKSSHIVMKSTSHSRFPWHNFHNLQCSSFPHVSSHELASGWPIDGPSALQSATGASSLHPERPPSSI